MNIIILFLLWANTGIPAATALPLVGVGLVVWLVIFLAHRGRGKESVNG
jgi:hypothetical protein